MFKGKMIVTVIDCAHGDCIYNIDYHCTKDNIIIGIDWECEDYVPEKKPLDVEKVLKDIKEIINNPGYKDDLIRYCLIKELVEEAEHE